MADDRRYRIARVDPRVFVDLCLDGPTRLLRIVRRGLPQDATAVNVYYDPLDGWLKIIVHSATFEPVPVGQVLMDMPSTQFQYLVDRDWPVLERSR